MPGALPLPRPRRRPPKAPAGATAEVDAPATNGPPVVTLRSGADPIGSILSANAAIPAVDASLLPTPAQVSFYVKASKPLPPLPTLVRADHALTQRLVTAGRKGKVGWTVLAAVTRLESNFGKRPGPLAGRGLATPPAGTGLAALATFLREHGATSNPLRPATAKKALTLYFGAKSPVKNRETNWVPAPNGTFSLYIRAYWAEQAILAGTWMPPNVERVN